MKTVLAYLVISFCLFQGILCWKDPGVEYWPREKRAVNQLPDRVRFTQKGVKTFFRKIDGFLADRLLFREPAQRAAARFFDIFQGGSDFDRAFRGKEGWLFLGNSFERTLDKLTGALPAPASIPRIEAIAKNRAAFPGPAAVFILGPNKSSVYPEKLPGFLRPAEARYVEPLLKALGESGLAVVDPTGPLRQARSQGPVYYRTDSHWNLKGAAVAAELAVARLNEAGLRGLALPDFSLVPAPPKAGDLVSLGNFFDFQVEPGDNFSLAWTETREELVLIYGGERRALASEAQLEAPPSSRPLTVINPQAASGLRAWVFRDSFFTALSPYFHSIFAETTHFPWRTLETDGPWPEGEEPDVIIYQVVERSL